MNYKIPLSSALVVVSIAALVPFLVFTGVARAAITTMSEGMSGNAVSELQTFLATDPSIYPEGLVTGYYGALTVRAVQRFQCARGIVCNGTAATTGYGRVGPLTLAAIRGIGGSAGTSGDISAPIIYPATVTTSSNSATISWTTSESARSRVMYATYWPFLYATAPSVSSVGYGVGASIMLTGLQPNTTYYYTRESVDVNGNVQLTVNETFRTNP